jgi:hypothetical protein
MWPKSMLGLLCIFAVLLTGCYDGVRATMTSSTSVPALLTLRETSAFNFNYTRPRQFIFGVPRTEGIIRSEEFTDFRDQTRLNPGPFGGFIVLANDRVELHLVEGSETYSRNGTYDLAHSE